MVRKTIILVLILLIIIFVFFKFSKEGNIPDLITLNEKSFINPVINAGLSKHFIINFQPLRSKFLEIQKKYNFKTHIYFLYLNNAAWVGVNERDLFVTASLIKIPLAMSVYKSIEDGKLNESTQYTLEDINLNSEFGDLYRKGPDSTFTVKELVEIMLVYSDNTAANALYNILSRIGITYPLKDVYASMGWETENFNETPGYGLIHVKILSNMFLSLYNSTYLKPEHSNVILDYLTRTSFENEIVAGLPEDIIVSHKLGIYDKDKALSDCGIIYAPNREYILCLASVGAEKEKADQFMKEISEISYRYVIDN